MTLTVRAVREALELDAPTRDDRRASSRALPDGRARELGRDPLPDRARRGRGLARGPIDSARSRALRRGVATPPTPRCASRVEGTILTVIRELAEEAERSTRDAAARRRCSRSSSARGEEAVARTREQLAVLREAGVVDAGGAGLVEIVRGIAAHVSRRAAPRARRASSRSRPTRSTRSCRATATARSSSSRARGSTATTLERELAPLGDSLLVVGDATALKVHVHTDDPGAALCARDRRSASSSASRSRTCTCRRPQREDAPARTPRTRRQRRPRSSRSCAGEGNQRLFESMGATRIVDGGQTMNPSTDELLAAIERRRRREVVVLPNNANVVLAAEQAAQLSPRSPALVVPRARSRPGSRAMLAFDLGGRRARRTPRRWRRRAARVATGAVTVASRDASVDGLDVERGRVPRPRRRASRSRRRRASTPSRDAVVERLLGEPRDVLTFSPARTSPSSARCSRAVAERHPELELEVHRRAASRTTRSCFGASSVRAVPPPSFADTAAVDDRAGPRRARRGQRGLPRGARAAARRSRPTSRSSARSRTGRRWSTACRELDPDVVLMDYRLPALDGVQATTRAARRVPATSPSSCLTASANLARARRALRRRRGRVPDEGRATSTRSSRAIRSAASRAVQLTAENTAIVLDSTADFPEAPARFPNWRRRAALRPLRRRELPRLRRHRARASSTRGCARRDELPTTSQPTPADFARLTRSSPASSASLVLTSRRSSPGPSRARSSPRRAGGRGRVRVIDTRERLRRSRCSGSAIQRRLERGTTDEEIDAARRALQARGGAPLHARHARVPRARRPDRPGGRASPGSSCTSSRSSRSADGEVVPIKRVRGRSKALEEFERLFDGGDARRRRRCASASRTRTRPTTAEDLARARARARPEAAIEINDELGPVIGTHGGPGTLGLFWFDDPE